VRYVARIAAARTGRAIAVAVALTDTETGGQRVATWTGDAPDVGFDAAIASLGHEHHGHGALWVTGAGVALAAGGIALRVASFEAERQFNMHLDADGNVHGIGYSDAQALEQRSRTFAFASDGLLAASGLALGAGLVWLALPHRGVEIQPLPGGASLEVKF
jgi:hypothetical protein